MLAPRWVAAILALGGLEAVTSYALMAPTAPHVGAFRGVHSSRISPDIAMLAKKKGKGKKGKKSSAARPPPSPTPPAAAEAAFEAVPTPMPASPIAPASDQTPLAPPFDGAMAAPPSPLPPPPEVPPPAAADVSSSASRRAARRAARRSGDAAAPPSPDASPAAYSAAAYEAPRPTFDSDDPFAAEGSDLLAPEEGSFATILPSLDDFRARDRAAAESTAPVAEPAPTLPQRQQPEPQQQQLPSPEAFSQPASFAPSAPSAPATPQELLQERFFELLSFDTIDDRPVNEEPYDLTARLIGRGLPNKAGVYLLPYLQSGHMLLLGVLLLSSLVSYPGFPLTTVPSEYRGLLLQGLGINYVINAACAVYARGIAASKEEPVTFWMVKCFLFGGLALGELTEAVPMPTKPKNGRGAGM